MTDQFPPADFDDWAPDYDQGVFNNAGFPFDGYADVLRTIVQLAGAKPGETVLDLGIGTGNLAQLFAFQECEIWGIDFSAGMLKQAGRKLPDATLALVDVRAELPAHFPQYFHHIVSAYTLHHFPLSEKVWLVQRLLLNHLQPGGNVIIGDIAFPDAAAEEKISSLHGDEWEQEYYWLVDKTLTAYSQVGISSTFTPVSYCAGVFQFQQAKVKR
jgi:putative AdoMet-dependent methyltransferase